MTEKSINDRDLKNLKLVRNYFGEHDKSLIEHRCYAILDDLLIKLESLGDYDLLKNTYDSLDKAHQTASDQIQSLREQLAEKDKEIDDLKRDKLYWHLEAVNKDDRIQKLEEMLDLMSRSIEDSKHGNHRI